MTLLVAADEDGAIGRASGGLPWNLPDEKAHFRSHCAGKWLLLGRRTFEEMHGWFRDHVPLVLTHHGDSLTDPARAVRSVEEAISLAQAAAQAELVVIGGAEVFALALPLATDLWFTRVHGRTGGDVLFPRVHWADWRLVSLDEHPSDAAHVHAFGIGHWVRRGEEGR